MEKDKFGMGMLILMFIGVIVGVILLQPIAQQVGETTNTVAVANTSLDTVVNGTSQYLDYRSLSSVVIYNETGSVIVGSGNYTVTNNEINPTTGSLAVKITPDASAAYKSAWKVSGTAQPTTYIADSGGRAIAGLIVIFFALMVAFVALTPAQEKLKDLFGM